MPAENISTCGKLGRFIEDSSFGRFAISANPGTEKSD
jgi:hypothetical protein